MIIGFTAGAFDLCHAGHVLMLRECKEHCDKLIVGLHVDPSIERPTKNKPVQTLVERYIQLKGLSYVDEIIPYETEKDLTDILSAVKIHVRFIGGDYVNVDNFTGKSLCESLGIEIFYNSRNHRFSSSELRKRIEEAK